MERSKKYFIETFGCQMNVHDSEKIAGMLVDLGYIEGQSKEEADIIVFNTCCIRETAELKIMAKIGDTKILKKNNPNLIIVVCGCMTQQKGMKELLKKRFPFISLVIGTHNLEELEDYIKSYNQKDKFKGIVWDKEQEIREDTKIYRTSTNNNAWVNIMYGCNNFCTYCIVPYVRGRERSRKVEDIVKEVEDLAKTGKYSNITLLGQNVNSYGLDFKDNKTNFVYLLDKLCAIEGNFTISFMSSHPKDFSFELIDFIASHDKMSRNLHLPCQSGSNEILKAMNRRYTIEKYKSLVDYIYKKIPEVNLTTDIIVGFPGESEENFKQTLDLLEYCKFSSIFGFVYSKRNGTPAASFENQVPYKIKQDRITRLFALQHKISREELNKMVGKTYQAIIEKNEKGDIVAKTINNKSVKIACEEHLIGSTQKIKVLQIKNNELIGQIV